jgi:hypothetical protein
MIQKGMKMIFWREISRPDRAIDTTHLDHMRALLFTLLLLQPIKKERSMDNRHNQVDFVDSPQNSFIEDHPTLFKDDLLVE